MKFLKIGKNRDEESSFNLRFNKLRRRKRFL
jgi:hypothetical protein